MADLQITQDGTIYHITEAAATPGIDLIVDFVSVVKFTDVQILAYYEGATNHSVSLQLYHWDTTSWHTWDSQDGIESTMTDHNFWIPCYRNYIGTGGDSGKVRVRFNHTMNGNASHDLYIDVTALYNKDWRLDRDWGPWR